MQLRIAIDLVRRTGTVEMWCCGTWTTCPGSCPGCDRRFDAGGRTAGGCSVAEHEAIKADPARWAKCPPHGIQELGPGVAQLELRGCLTCGSTLALPTTPACHDCLAPLTEGPVCVACERRRAREQQLLPTLQAVAAEMFARRAS